MFRETHSLSDASIDPLLMNAFNKVNLAGTCILTSTDYARSLGISESRWIYPLGGAGTSDSEKCKIWPNCNLKESTK